MKSKLNCALILMSLSLALLLNGCLGYKVGARLPEGINTVEVPSVINGTDEPLIETEITAAVMEEIQFDGTLRIADHAQGDAILEIEVTDYRLVPLTYDDYEHTRTQEYRLVLTADVVLRNRETRQIIAQNPSVDGEAEFFVAMTGQQRLDLTTAKDNGLAKAAHHLGENIVDVAVEAW